jgi:hypothetical protein
VAGARVTATDVDRGINFSTVADTAGPCILPGLPRARNELVVKAAGSDVTTQAAFQ